MKEIQKTVYVSDDGREWGTAGEALRADEELKSTEIMNELGIYWGGTSASEVAEKLTLAGYTIVKRGSSGELPPEGTA